MGYITSMTRHEELALSLFMPMIWDKSDLLNRGVEGNPPFLGKANGILELSDGCGIETF